MSDDLIRLEISADATQAQVAIREVSSSADQLSGSLKKVGTAGAVAGNEIAAGMEKADFSMREAKGTAMLLGEEIGVKMNRHVAGFIATLPGVGEAMSAAFSGFALIALGEIIVHVTEKATDWIANTFIMTDAMRQLDSQLKSDNATIAKMAEHVTALNLQMDLIGKSGSQKTGFLMGLKEEEIDKQSEALRALKDNLYGLKNGADIAGESQATLEGKITVATDHLNELAAEQGLLSAQFEEETNKEIESAAKKHEQEMEKIWKEQDRVDEENRKDALKRSADFLREFEKGEKDLEKLEEEHGNLMQTFNEDTGGNGYARFAADATDATNQLDQAEQRLLGHAKLVMEGLAKPESAVEAQKQIQAAIQQSETVLIKMMPTVNDLSKGWAAYGKSAVHALEEAGLAMVEHLAVALLVSDTMRLHKAKEAATSAFAEGEKIPMVGPIMGPILGASAFAGAMAFEKGGVVPSAAGGMLTDAYGPDSGSLALLHPNEMVLPAPLSQTVQDMAASASGSSGSAGGDVHIHAMDSKSFESFLKRNPTALSRGVEHATDKGHLNVGKLARGK